MQIPNRTMLKITSVFDGGRPSIVQYAGGKYRPVFYIIQIFFHDDKYISGDRIGFARDFFNGKPGVDRIGSSITKSIKILYVDNFLFFGSGLFRGRLVGSGMKGRASVILI